MLHRLLVSLAFGVASIAWGAPPVRMLEIPIRGTIGADVTFDGLEQALLLAEAESLDGVIVLVDSLGGDLTTGRQLARRIKACPVPTIALIREAGGAALPAVFACDRWAVVETTTIEVSGPDGKTRVEGLGADRIVLRTLPSLRIDGSGISKELEAIGQAMVSAIPTSIDQAMIEGRRTLAGVLSDPRLDLLLTTPPSTTPALRSTDGGSRNEPRRWRVSRQGPGLSGVQIETLDLGDLVADAPKALAEILGHAELATDGQSGTLLVVSDADDRLDRRRRVQSLTDRMLGSLDSASSLVDAMPWSLARARLSLPTSSRLRNTFPMELEDGAWRIASGDPRRRWEVACRDSARRWNGIVEIIQNVEALIERSGEAQESLNTLEIDDVDRDRLEAALACWSERLDELRSRTRTWNKIGLEASTAIAEVERWIQDPPSITVDR